MWRKQDLVTKLLGNWKRAKFKNSKKNCRSGGVDSWNSDAMVWNWQVEGGLIIYTGFRYSFNLVPRKGAGRWETLGTRSILWRISWLKKGQACHNFLTCVLIRSKYFSPGDWLINRASGYTRMRVSSEWLIICLKDRSTTAGCFGLSTSNNDPPATTVTHNLTMASSWFLEDGLKQTIVCYVLWNKLKGQSHTLLS